MYPHLHPVSIERLEQRALLATFVVTNTNDTHAGSLRAAISAGWVNQELPDEDRHDGFRIFTEGPGTIVAGNYIGTDAPGPHAVPNADGVSVGPGATQSRVGGTTPADANLISGNGAGVFVDTGKTETSTIEGNLIGTNAAGTAAVGNGTGAQLSLGHCTVGGTSAAARNVISGN